MGIKFDSKTVKQAFYEIAKLGGDTKKIDTENEFAKLSEYLANNRNNMSANDINTIEGFCIEKTTPISKQTATVNVDVNGDNNKTQVITGDNNVVINGDVQNSGNLAIGNNNEQNQYGTAPAQVKEDTPKIENKDKAPSKPEKKPVKNTTKPKSDAPKSDRTKAVTQEKSDAQKSDTTKRDKLLHSVDYLKDDKGYYYLDDNNQKHYVDNPGMQAKGAIIYNNIEQALCDLDKQGLDKKLLNEAFKIYGEKGDEAAIQFLRNSGIIVGKIGTF